MLNYFPVKSTLNNSNSKIDKNLEESRDVSKRPTVKIARNEEREHRKVCCDSCESKELLCYFMCNETHGVLLRVSNDFQVCLKQSH